MDLCTRAPADSQQFQPSAILEHLATFLQSLLGHFASSPGPEQQQPREQHEELPTPRDVQIRLEFVPSEDGRARLGPIRLGPIRLGPTGFFFDSGQKNLCEIFDLGQKFFWPCTEVGLLHPEHLVQVVLCAQVVLVSHQWPILKCGLRPRVRTC